MLDIKITAADINWESFVDFVFPKVLEKIASSDKQSLVIKVLKNSGSDLLPVLRKILSMLTDGEKAEFIQWAVNAFEEKILSAINSIIADKKLSDCVSVAGVRAYSGSVPGEIELQLKGVNIDYAAPAVRDILAEKLSVKLPAAFTGFVGRTAQSAIIKILSNKTFSQKLSDLADGKLRGMGIEAKIAGLEIIKESDSEKPAPSPARLGMPEKLESCILRVAGEVIKQLGN